MNSWIKGGLVLLAVCMVYGAGYERAESRWQEKWARRDASDAFQSAQQEAFQRTEEQRRQQAADEEQKRADKELAKVHADAAGAQYAADGLRSELRRVQRQLADSETGKLTATIAAGTAKAEAAVLLAELLRESDDLAGKYAQEADNSYAAGSSCERTYDRVTANSR